MPRKRFTEEQIIAVLKEADTGMRVPDVCRKFGISDCTFYTWKNKYGGMQVSDVRRKKSLEDENRRLKQIVADLTLDVQALRAINSKNF
jgi:putative transposase